MSTTKKVTLNRIEESKAKNEQEQRTEDMDIALPFVNKILGINVIKMTSNVFSD